MSESERTRRTYRLELRRAMANGVLESAGSTFLLLIAVKWFAADATAKGFIAAGSSIGLMLTPVAVSQVARRGWPTAKAASLFATFGAGIFLLMATFPWLSLYVVGSILTMSATSLAVPLMTQIYQENYPADQRGKLFSRTVMVRIAAAATFSGIGGRVLATNMEYFRWLLLLYACAFAFSSHWLAMYPSTHLVDEGGSHPFRAMRFVREDPLFRRTLICWMLMGFANLMMLPMRIEYLANEKYGLHLDVRSIALLIGVVPNLARLVMSQVWGRLFDRMNFFLLRVTLNIGFALGILTFFMSDSLTGLVAGAIIYGISNAGGDVAWGLWVTKFAPPHRVADYMSVHTFFTGVRGVLAPLFAFHLVNRLSPSALGGISAGLIVIASLLLLPEVRFGKSIRPAQALTTGVSD